MTGKPGRSKRRAGALSRGAIVQAAIDILDSHGEAALTFRALATRLATGSGAIYWHVADKGELLAAAADHLLGAALSGEVRDAEPRAAIRAVALALFDIIDAHPWVEAPLSREPWRPAMLGVYEGLGGRLQALGVSDDEQFGVWSALLSYVLGAAAQNAANARRLPREVERSTFLATVAAKWAQLDPADFPFMHRMTTQIREHDDREQFLAGLDLMLNSIANTAYKP